MNGYIDSPKCKTCLYRTYIEGLTCCLYMGLTGNRRNSPVDNCDKYVEFVEHDRRELNRLEEKNTVKRWRNNDAMFER